jgi:hypothetical protein
MRDTGQHVVVHSRVSLDWSEFIGSRVYEEYVRVDDKFLRASYSDPIPVRTSLVPQDDGVVPVGNMVESGSSVWYIVDEQEGVVFLEPGVFFRAGESAAGHIQFWNPLQNRICRAAFQGAERPPTRSPDLQPSNLEAAISHLGIAGTSAPGPTVEWVKPELKLDKHRRKPVRFSTEAGLEIRTGWERWKAEGDDARWVFVCVGLRTGNEYWAEYLPGEWVQPLWEEPSEKPIQFYNSAGELIKTIRAKWLPGKDDSFFAYLQQGIAYLTMVCLPGEGK